MFPAVKVRTGGHAAGRVTTKVEIMVEMMCPK